MGQFFEKALKLIKANKYVKVTTRLPDRVLKFPGREKMSGIPRSRVTRDCKAYLAGKIRVFPLLYVSLRLWLEFRKIGIFPQC